MTLDEELSDLIKAGVPVNRIGKLADGTWAYIPPCPNEPDCTCEPTTHPFAHSSDCPARSVKVD